MLQLWSLSTQSSPYSQSFHHRSLIQLDNFFYGHSSKSTHTWNFNKFEFNFVQLKYSNEPSDKCSFCPGSFRIFRRCTVRINAVCLYCALRVYSHSGRPTHRWLCQQWANINENEAIFSRSISQHICTSAGENIIKSVLPFGTFAHNIQMWSGQEIML